MMFELIQYNFVGVAIMLFLILFILTNNNFEKKTNRLFLVASCCVLILIIEEAWEAQLALELTFAPLRIPLSAVGYSLRPVIPYVLVLIFKSYTRVQRVLMSIPLAVNALVSFSSLFCGVAFGYSADNEFIRGPLGLTPFLVAGFYVLILLALTIQECRQVESMEALIVSAIVLLAFVSTIMESLFHFQFIQNPCIGTSITFYYLFLHSNRNNRDPLTGALTRRRFYLDAENRRQTLSAVISLDLNDLKTLNDQHGHMEGDKALLEVSGIIKKNTGAHAFVYRTGGDEFMILCHRLSEKNVQDMISNIRAELQNTKYRCAIGYALYSNDMEFDQVCQLADSMMYEDKRRMKSRATADIQDRMPAEVSGRV